MTILHGKRILLVDDEDVIREMLRDEFQALGAVVDEASGGVAALQMATNAVYDAVISDARMPDGDGLDLAIGLHRMAGRRPMFFLCSGMGLSDFPDVAACGVVAVFGKPLDFGDITSTVARSLLGPAD